MALGLFSSLLSLTHPKAPQLVDTLPLGEANSPALYQISHECFTGLEVANKALQGEKKGKALNIRIRKAKKC